MNSSLDITISTSRWAALLKNVSEESEPTESRGILSVGQEEFYLSSRY